MPPEVLERVLADVDVFPNPKVLVGFESADDAGVYLLDEERALVQTVDFFTPVVDDPFLYGQIAAANSLSDVYAMGGRPQFALCILGFPQGRVGEEVLSSIVRGGSDKMREAGVSVIGGHSVQDPEIKFGYCVTGLVERNRLYTNAGAQAGDVLLLTKPLGTGIVATGIKFGKSSQAAQEEAAAWMGRLNAAAATCLSRSSVHAVTDVTGYGLIGHAWEMARAAGRTFQLEAGAVPVLAAAEELARQGMLPGGIESNRAYVGEAVRWEGVEETRQQIMLDPQTSGGLLIALPPAEASPLAEALEQEGDLAARIGQVSEQLEPGLLVRA